MDFTFWSGGAITARRLEENGDLEAIEDMIECYAEGLKEPPTETQINDILWFETDWIAVWLGYEDWYDYCMNRHKDDDE